MTTDFQILASDRLAGWTMFHFAEVKRFLVKTSRCIQQNINFFKNLTLSRQPFSHRETNDAF